ncbi:MAG: PQQ-binding-like beta-propeller repeat protein, partial [Planctomycetales bacterium]|nr:PQQ-binding-like beta-propeller repeat protein [Planctomycetales bacterium]
DGDRVYATSATGFLWCVNLADGEVIWTADLLELANWNQTTFEVAAPWGYAGSPLLVDGLCVVTLGGPIGGSSSASLLALDAHTGEAVWKSGDDQLSYASPILATLDGQRQIVSVNEKTVSGHQISDGKMLWQFDWPGSTNTGANCSSAVPVGSDRLLVGKGYGGGSALVEIKHADADWKTNDVWRSSRVLKTKFNHTCVDGNIGYAISNGSLQAVNLDDATDYWTQPRHSRAGQGQVVLAGDVLVMQDETGDLVLVDATKDDYHELLRLPALDSKTWNIPTVAGRYVLVRNDRQAICFEFPEK